MKENMKGSESYIRNKRRTKEQFWHVGWGGFSLMKETEEFPKSLLPSFTLSPWDIIKKSLKKFS